ncbi:MarR family winged helix-turn-helix transcriptional regulator [Fusibacter sp. JL298sf-3]
MIPIMKYINQSARCGVLYRNEVFKDIGILDHQHAYILHICAAPGIRQDILAKKVYVNKSNVARQLAQLEKRGLVYREVSHDNRRHMCVYPTEKCLAIHPLVKSRLADWHRHLVSDLTDSEQQVLSELLSKVAEKARHAPARPTE